MTDILRDRTDIFCTKFLIMQKNRNNGFAYDCVSGNVTFFKNKGGPTTHDEMLVNHNPFSYTNYDGTKHPENTNEECFQYNYQSVLDQINVCIKCVLAKSLNMMECITH